MGTGIRWSLRVLPTSRVHGTMILIQHFYATDEEIETQREAGLYSRSHRDLVVLKGLDPEFLSPHL